MTDMEILSATEDVEMSEDDENIGPLKIDTDSDSQVWSEQYMSDYLLIPDSYITQIYSHSPDVYK